MLSIIAGIESSASESLPMLAARRALRGTSVSWIVVGALAVVAIVALWLFVRWWMGEGSARMRNSPRALFAELCRAHGLAASERQLLLALAESRQLAQPGALFVDRDHFDEQRLSAMLAPRKGELRALRGRLFAGLDDAKGDDTTPSDAAGSDAAANPENVQNASPALN